MEASYDSHSLKFFRDRNNPRRCVATCSCGWTIDGETRLVYDRAASHDQFAFAPIQEAVSCERKS